MKTQRAVGIAGYGAYVPRYRVKTADISAVWRAKGAIPAAIKEKSVVGPDEDAVTMAIEAARTALARSQLPPASVGAVWLGTESPPYAAKPTATIVAEALGVTPHTLAADLEFACKAGSEAMQGAAAFVASGMVESAIAIGVDTAQSRPNDALEYTAACGGAALVFALADKAVAIVEASSSYATDTPDFFRRQGEAYPQHGGRFTGEPGYFRHTLAASRQLLKELGAQPGDYAYCVFHQPVPKFVEKVSSELGFTKAQYETGLCARRIGNIYAGSSLLGLAAVLDVAQPGDRIFFCSYGSGAGSDAFSFRATDRLPAQRSGPSVVSYLDRRRVLSGYGQYLRYRRKIRES
jgi:hydroxymethylglutaryl-CoA synthase